MSKSEKKSDKTETQNSGCKSSLILSKNMKNLTKESNLPKISKMSEKFKNITHSMYKNYQKNSNNKRSLTPIGLTLPTLSILRKTNR